MTDPEPSTVPLIPPGSPIIKARPRKRSVFFRDLLLVGIAAVVTLGGVVAYMLWDYGPRALTRRPELAALQDSIELVQEFRELRDRGVDHATWTAFENRATARLQTHIPTLRQRAGITRPESHKLLWAAKYRIPEMITHCRTAPGPAETECLHMLYEAAVLLGEEFPPDLLNEL